MKLFSLTRPDGVAVGFTNLAANLTAHLTTNLVLILLVASFTLSHPTPVRAQTVVFTDDFSQGFNQWQPTRNGQLWSIVDGKAEAYVPTYSTITEMVPKDQYWDGSWHNIEYAYDLTSLEGDDKNTSFGYQDLLNWYEIHFNRNTLNLVRVQNGTAPFNIFQGYELRNGITYHVRIIFNEGHISVFINNDLVVDKIDWSFNSNFGKIGIKAGTGASAPTRLQYDNIVVKTLAAPPTVDTELPVRLFKQTDPLWSNTIYDRAQSWSTKPTIGRWGCALTSLVMIMHYHGLTKLPDATPLTPASLNTWLNSQTDGYIGEGLVNWIAATRLTRLISEVFPTPKLEYQRVNGATMSRAITEIKEHRPAMLQIDGHFLVARGFTNDEQDLFINDPAYVFTKFSQHQKPLLSTRAFIPSHTDLSYLQIVSDSGLAITLTDAQGSPLPNQQVTTEYLTSDPVEETPKEKSRSSQITLLAKPTAGTYFVKISQPQLAPFTVAIYAYDQGANPTQKVFSGLVGTEPIVIQLNYQKNAASIITMQTSIPQLRRILTELYQQKKISKTIPWQKLDQTLMRAEKTGVSQQRRLLALFRNQLQTYSFYFEKMAYGWVRQYSNNL